ncbi:hypothetical protein A5655_02680 [Mycobacterium sp. 1081908.1]|nr:hypothetical protein A5655_02680 [Mycobacterium sp. 1081908.1]
MVFWMPRARPLQNGPANSVMAVASRPLSSTASTEMVTISGMSNRESRRSERASRNRVSAAAAAMTATGCKREPMRSDQRPTATRPAAPSSCDSVTRPPAAATDQWWWFISQTSMNVTVTVCGIMSRPATAWMRHSTDDPRYGLASSAVLAASRGLRTGLTMPRALATVAAVHTSAGNISPACGPRSASSGMISAPAAMPNGCAVCRIPIARPRCCGGNHADTSRPPAVLQLAAAMPPTNR